MHKGKLIVFEGNEGSGKSMIAKMCHKWLQEIRHDCILTSAPGGTAVGQKMRDILLSQNKLTFEAETLLFASDLAQLTQEVIKPALEAGITVLCDRYFYSTLAYQSCGRGLSFEDVLSIVKFATNNIQPDLTIWLDVDPEIGLARKDPNDINRFEQESLDFHKNVRKGYYQTEAYPEVVRIETSDPIDKVFAKAQAHLRSLLLSHY